MTPSTGKIENSLGATKHEPLGDPEKHENPKFTSGWRKLFRRSGTTGVAPTASEASSEGFEQAKAKPEKWSLGILNDKETDEVPGKLSHGRHCKIPLRQYC